MITITSCVARRAAALGLGAGLLWGAFTASPGMAASLFDDGEARKQIAAERQRIDELRQDLNAQQRELNTQQKAVDARMGRLEETLKNQPLLDLFSQLEALKVEMSRLRGQIEVLNNNIDNTAKRQRDMYLDLDTRLRRFEQPAISAPASGSSPSATPSASNPPSGSVASSAGSGPASAGPTAPAAGTPGVPATAIAAAKPATVAPNVAPAATVANVDTGAEIRAYEAAQSQRRSGNYQAAIASFQSFIKQYPKSSLAPRAQYWIGDSYFNLRDYKLAIASQQALISTYSDSPTVPDAMLNIASSQIEMGESNAGRKMLEELVVKYPISDAADKAKRRLASFSPTAKQ